MTCSKLFVAWINHLLLLDANGLSISSHKETGRVQEVQKEDIGLAMELLHET